MSELVSFNFNETKPDFSSFPMRYKYLLSVTDPFNAFYSNKEIRDGVATVKKYKEMATKTTTGDIQVSMTEKANILRGVRMMNSCTNDVGDIISWPWRLCCNMWTNIPIISFMMLSPPTMGFTMFSQWINQNYNAGLNYGNKNGTCKFSERDIAVGYTAAVASSMMIATAMRKATSGLTKGATREKIVFLNYLVGGSAAACANFSNAWCMRYAEMQKGIEVYKDEKLTESVGISQRCAVSAVQ